MRIWTTEHIYEWVHFAFIAKHFIFMNQSLPVFRYPWHTVVNAAFRKYPNPMNLNITAMDIVQV
jgi:hypothetical protein